MNKNIIIVAIVIIIIGIGWFVLSSGGGSSDRISTDTSRDASVPASGSSSRSFDKAPSFELKDYDGNDVSSSDFEGKILVVNSWATWCPFCVNELPAFGLLQEEFPDEVVVIAIDRSESLAVAKKFSDQLGLTDKYVFLLDPKDSFYKSIGGFSMPETLFVDTEGNIRIHKRGPMEFSEMKEKINNILSESN